MVITPTKMALRNKSKVNFEKPQDLQYVECQERESGNCGLQWFWKITALKNKSVAVVFCRSWIPLGKEGLSDTAEFLLRKAQGRLIKQKGAKRLHAVDNVQSIKFNFPNTPFKSLVRRGIILFIFIRLLLLQVYIKTLVFMPTSPFRTWHLLLFLHIYFFFYMNALSALFC